MQFIYRKLVIVALGSGLLLGGTPGWAIDNDYAQDVATSSNPSPIDLKTGSSLNQFGEDQTDSQIDNYVNQDEQINLDKDAGTVRVLRTNQKAVINDFVTEIIELKNANPRELRGLARTICRKEGGNADVLRDKVSGETYLVVVCPEYMLGAVRETLQALDKEWIKEVNDGSWQVYYKGRHRDVRKLMPVLGFYRSPDGVWDFDDANNALLFFDQPNVEGLFTWGTETVDIPPSIATLQVSIYEVDTNNDLLLGFDFANWKNDLGRNLFEYILWDFDDVDEAGLFPAGGVSPNWGVYHSYNAHITTAYIDFLQAKGRARLLTQGSITAKSGTTGVLKAFDPVAAFEMAPAVPAPQVINPTVDPDAELVSYRHRFLNYRQMGEVGIYMSATPVIGLETAQLSLDLDISNVVGHTPTGMPIIERRFAANDAVVKCGQPIVMSGIQRETDVKTTSGVPFLRDLPVLGYFFGREVTTKQQKDLVVIVTPRLFHCTVGGSDIPAEYETLISMAKGEDALEVPSNPFGFDQWLLD